MITIRPLTERVIPSAMVLSVAANWNQTTEDWNMILKLGAGGCIGAYEGDELVGTVGAIRYPQGFGFISMMLVHPDHRGKGIARTLMQHVLDLLSDQPVVVLDATDAGRQVYGKLGFRDEFSITRMVCRQPDRHLSDSEAEHLTENDLAAVFAKDLSVFGGDRSALLRTLFDREKNGCCAMTTGYCFSRRGREFVHIGPLISDDEASGQQLLARCMAVAGDCPLIIDVPDHHQGWKKWLMSIGFIALRSFTRMSTGTGKYKTNLPAQLAIAGPELG